MQNDITLKIKELIRKKKYTQVEFSEKIGKTKQTLNNYFSGRTKIDVDTLIKIAEVFDVPVAYFFEGGNDNEVDKKSLDIFKKLMEFGNSFMEGANVINTDKDKLATIIEGLIAGAQFMNYIKLTYEDLDHLYKSKIISNGFYNALVEMKKENEKPTPVVKDRKKVKIIKKEPTNFTFEEVKDEK